MVDKPREVFERVQQQPAEEQDYIAEMVQRELEDQKWECSADLRLAIEAPDTDYTGGDAMDFADYDRQHGWEASPSLYQSWTLPSRRRVVGR